MDPDLGPSPFPVGDALTPARRRVLDAVASAGRVATLALLSETLGGHPNAARQHLDSLVAAGFLSAEQLPAQGRRGRPARAYALTPLGRRSRDEGAPLAYVQLVDALAEHLAATGLSGEAARAIGLAWKAAGPAGLESHEPWQAVQGVLSELGFSPVVHPEEPEVIQLRTCPLLAAARRHPEVICPIHQGLLDAALAAAGRPGVAVRLHPFAEPGACLVTRTPEGQPG